MPASFKEDLAFLPGETLEHSDDGVTLLEHDGTTQIGQVYLTNAKLAFRLRPARGGPAKSAATVLVQVPLGAVTKVVKMGGQSSRTENAYGLIVHCKDYRVLKFAYPTENHSRRELYDKLQELAFCQKAAAPYFAFLHGQVERTSASTQAWKRFDFRQEMARLGVPGRGWRITELNAKYEVAPTYPALIGIPESITDEEMIEASNFRSKNRMQGLSWIHPVNGASMTRCSQPRVGTTGKRSSADEHLVKAIREANPTVKTKVHILDARPKANAVANKLKGFGYEAKSAYENMEFTFFDIHNIHVMRDSLKNLVDACYPKINEAGWDAAVEGSRWLRHVRLVLLGAVRIVELMSTGNSCIVHCSDGWDRTAQLTALPMLIMDPYYRTQVGFEVLIEKEWLSFGHKFGQRIGHGCDPDTKPSERSPIFVQFVDCVWQVMRRFPRAFEFNERFLVTILDHLYSCQYGNFLYNCERERSSSMVRYSMNGREVGGTVPELSRSLWEWTALRAKDYLNPLYDPSHGPSVLEVTGTMRQLEVWTAYYGRWSSSPPSFAATDIEGRVHEVNVVVDAMEAECRELETQLEAAAADERGEGVGGPGHLRSVSEYQQPEAAPRHKVILSQMSDL